jgi:hypothetical protein
MVASCYANIKTDQSPGSAGRIYAYMLQLRAVLEQITDLWDSELPHKLCYRDRNLKFAIQRHLYWSYLHDRELFDLYSAFLDKSLPERVVVSHEAVCDLAFFFCNQEVPRHCFVIARENMIKSRLRDLRNGLRNFFARYRARSDSKSTTNVVDGCRTMIYLSQPRFLKFLEPLLGRLPVDSFAFLNPEEELREVLQMMGLQSISAPLLPQKPIKSHSDRLGHLPLLFDLYHAILEKSRPERVVLVEGNSPVDEIIGQVCHSLRIGTVCIQQGWDSLIQTGFRNMSFTKMLVWGEGFANILKPLNPNQKILPVGNFHLDIEGSVKERQNGSLGFLLQAPARMIPRKSWEDCLNLIERCALYHPSCNIAIREHPKYPLDEDTLKRFSRLPNVSVRRGTDQSLMQFLDGCKFTVSMYSSTIYESVAAGVPVILLNPIGIEYHPSLAEANAALQVENYVEACRAVDQLVNDRFLYLKLLKGVEQFRSSYFNTGCRETTLESIAREVMETNCCA